MTELLALRRIADGPRTVRSGLRAQRRYELRYPTGEHQIVTLRQLDTILRGRSFPADFWACVGAADAAFAVDQQGVLIEWPSGRRTDRA